ncbi:MAG TPA: hypothetical protein VH459_02875 [Gaiellales bacterium]|jgi:hypothetical protein
MTRDSIRGFLIIIGVAIVATVFFNVSQRIFDIVLGTLSLLFIVLMWYFGYSWYRSNRMAISLMPDRQRNVLYLGMGAVTIAFGCYSVDAFGFVDLGSLFPLLVIAGLAGAFAMFWAVQESKRYYL